LLTLPSPNFAMHNDPGRIWLRHDPPPWIDPAVSSYFMTICCQTRGTNQLCHPGVGEALLNGARIYHEQRNFFEHRLRSEESVQEKAAYILQNPVRAGLVAEGCAWLFTLRLD
jgi:hypothetical protein